VYYWTFHSETEQGCPEQWVPFCRNLLLSYLILIWESKMTIIEFCTKIWSEKISKKLQNLSEEFQISLSRTLYPVNISFNKWHKDIFRQLKTEGTFSQ
jgi:hypothetical protein